MLTGRYTIEATFDLKVADWAINNRRAALTMENLLSVLSQSFPVPHNSLFSLTSTSKNHEPSCGFKY